MVHPVIIMHQTPHHTGTPQSSQLQFPTLSDPTIPPSHSTGPRKEAELSILRQNPWAIPLLTLDEADTIPIHDLDKVLLLMAFYHASWPEDRYSTTPSTLQFNHAHLVWAKLQREVQRTEARLAQLPPQYQTAAQAELHNTWHLSTLFGRVLEINLSGNTLDPRLRDRVYGPGNCALVVNQFRAEILRTGRSKPCSTTTPTNSGGNPTTFKSETTSRVATELPGVGK
jgi:hypothetical protein